MAATKNNKGISTLIILLVLALLAGGGYYYYTTVLDQAPLPVTEDTIRTPSDIEVPGDGELAQGPQVVPTPTPRPLPVGSQTYTVSGNFAGPNITEVTINPVNATAGSSQTITIKATDTSPITSVTATVKLDSAEATAQLTRISGSDTNGTWQGTLTFPQGTMNTNYTITERAVSARGTSETVTTIR